MSLRTELALRIALAALLAGAALWVALTFFYIDPEDDPPIGPSAPDPAAYAVAEVIEEARRITMEAT